MAISRYQLLSQIACDETWKKEAADYMKAAIRHIEKKYGDRVYGYFLLCGTTTEWFSHFDKEAPHPIKNAGYQKWLGDKNAQLPPVERLEKEGGVFLGEDERDVYWARKFQNELIADLALYFVEEAQSVTRHRKLMGLYYGYLFELGGQRLYNDGALTPIGDISDFEDIANAVWFLGTDLSKNITGTELTVDGGMSCQLYPRVLNTLLAQNTPDRNR